MVSILSLLGILILVAGLIGTFILAAKKEPDYSSSTRGNMTRLILIYIILLIGLGIGIWIYVEFANGP